MIHAIDANGTIQWECRHVVHDRACGTRHTHHIAHEAIQWCGLPEQSAERQTVRLPPCEKCGAQTYLKVHFTEEELQAPNMFVSWTSEHAQALIDLQMAYEAEPEETAHKAALALQIRELEALRDAGGLHTRSHAIAQNHMELARQLKASGKHPHG